MTKLGREDAQRCRYRWWTVLFRCQRKVDTVTGLCFEHDPYVQDQLRRGYLAT